MFLYIVERGIRFFRSFQEVKILKVKYDGMKGVFLQLISQCLIL